jgi:hypothetical protein
MSGLVQREEIQMDINCPSCHSAVFDAGDKYVCEKMDQCPGDFKVWGKIAGYVITPEDLAIICAGKETPEREMTSKAGKPFHASLVWDDKERKVAFKFQNTRETLEGVVCPDHGCELRGSEKRYYCPTKISDGVWCPVGSWRTIGSHVVTKEELADLLDGVPVGPWEMKRRDGSGTYQVLAEYDFDENKVITNIYGSASKAS